jgi:hypothetical protein
MTEIHKLPAAELPISGATWFKSSYSDGSGNNCVEVADMPGCVGIRDSKDEEGPALLVPGDAWASFVGLVRSGAADFGVV